MVKDPSLSTRDTIRGNFGFASSRRHQANKPHRQQSQTAESSEFRTGTRLRSTRGTSRRLVMLPRLSTRRRMRNGPISELGPYWSTWAMGMRLCSLKYSAVAASYTAGAAAGGRGGGGGGRAGGAGGGAP